jgi:hypothetical protein
VEEDEEAEEAEEAEDAEAEAEEAVRLDGCWLLVYNTFNFILSYFSALLSLCVGFLFRRVGALWRCLDVMR